MGWNTTVLLKYNVTSFKRREYHIVRGDLIVKNKSWYEALKTYKWWSERLFQVKDLEKGCVGGLLSTKEGMCEGIFFPKVWMISHEEHRLDPSAAVSTQVSDWPINNVTIPGICLLRMEWKHLMLVLARIVCKPIDSFIQGSEQRNFQFM